MTFHILEDRNDNTSPAILTYGECYLIKVLNEFQFSLEGMRQQRDWYNRLWKRVF